jgi:trk system potassium uptake protein TrkH
VLRFASIGHVLGQFLLFLAAALTAPILYGLLTSFGSLGPLLISLFICALAGGLLTFLLPRPTGELRQREALLLVAGIWASLPAFGGLPFYLSPEFPSFSDAFFEAASGFSASGATVLSDIEGLGRPVLLWRCLTHWLGGMGIILLGVAVLPLLAQGGASLYRAEFSGKTAEKLKPRITETALALWKVYLGLSLASYMTLRWAGMGNFDALCHTFSVMGTGGFSTRSASVASFQNPAVEYAILAFMFLGGISMILHYWFWLELRLLAVLKDSQLRAYVSILLVAGVVAAVSLRFHGGYTWEPALRAGFFQVTSIMTTSGLVTDDFELWHPFGQMLLLGLMFVGGCTGSTSGGLKVARLLLLAKWADREFKRMVERRGVFAIRLGTRVIPESTVQRLLTLVYIALGVILSASLLLASMGVDVLTSLTAAIAAVFNIGPAFGRVGPFDNYGWLPAGAKWVLSVCMIAGRLEFYSALVLVTPQFWRR